MNRRLPIDVEALSDLDLRRPLDPFFRSIKLKLGFLIAGAVAVTVFVFWVGIKIGLWPSASGALAIVVAMVFVYFLSRGMTSPLREMAAAAEAMAKGDYSRRVTTTSHDEVGALARAFNKMAAELAETDRVRRDLVANVSHELRTPITALQARSRTSSTASRTPTPTRSARCSPRSSASAGWSSSCSTSPGSKPAPCRSSVRSSASSRSSSTRSASSSSTNPTSTSRSASNPPISPPTATPSASIRWSRTCSRTRCASHRAAAPSRSVRIAASDGVMIEVLDEGPGIPEADRTRVFNRFERLDAARSSSGGGAGLGLAIARWIVDLHGGEIRPETRDPHGCRMVVTLPPR